MNRIILSAVAASGALLSQPALAETATSNMAVSASVPSECSVDAGALAFGEVETSGATNATTGIDVICTGGGAYTVGLGNGLHSVSSQRSLRSGDNFLAYGLFKDAGRTDRWGDAGAELVSGTGSGGGQTLVVYGEIEAGQTLLSGDGTPYTDTILVTLTY